jgi:hypothetical protein
MDGIGGPVMKMVQLPVEVFNAMVQILGKRPFDEVAGIMNAISQTQKMVDESPPAEAQRAPS